MAALPRFADIGELFSFASPRRRRQLLPLGLLMLAGAVAELVSIGAIIPFLAFVANPDAAALGPLRAILSAVGIVTPFQILLTVTAAFVASALLAAAIRLLLLFAGQRFVFGVIHELGVAVYQRTLRQPFSYHVNHNSSEIIGTINKVQYVANGLLAPLMQAATACVISVFILAGLLFVNPIVALASGAGFAFIYLLVMVFTRSVMWRNGLVFAKSQDERIQAVNEGLGGIRDVLLDHTQPIFVSRFAEVEYRMRRSQSVNTFLSAAPRFVVEGLGMALIAVIAMAYSVSSGGLLDALPTLGALALGAQRLMPLLQQIYTGWAAYLNNGRSLQDILDILRMPDAPQFAFSDAPEPMTFDRDIRLENVSFKYDAANRAALVDKTLTIRKGERVGFVGRTGSGKSTLMDLVLGLLKPTGGRILIDGVELTDANCSSWQRRIAHVPQSIYLADATVAENIAFGVAPRAIDHDRVVLAAAKARIADVIEQMPQGYDTFVGERGIRLSGGQRQRLGIARALYKQADVLIFDEATSALDTETETAVMQAIEELDRELTILMIAHRLSTVEGCDKIVRLTDDASAAPVAIASKVGVGE